MLFVGLLRVVRCLFLVNVCVVVCCALCVVYRVVFLVCCVLCGVDVFVGCLSFVVVVCCVLYGAGCVLFVARCL